MGSEERVVVVRTGTANTASVCAALKRLGVNPLISEIPEEVAGAERLVLPGVGTFGAAMTRLRDLGLVEVLRERLMRGDPTLAICLGMQLLCRGSDESPGLEGFGVIGDIASAFGTQVRVPQLGWNSVDADEGCRLLESGCYYFANSYRLEHPAPGWSAGVCDYGGEFVAALERERVLACQFHPELSGSAGLSLISRWLRAGKGGARC